MFFAGPADAYDDFMGRYSRQLAPGFAAFAGVEPGQRVLDVGCGPGALTEVLAGVVGAGAVAAAEPSPGYRDACAARVPGADVRLAPAEDLPWRDGTVDVALAQLVVHFLTDPDVGVREMRRVVRPGGTVAACTWDSTGGMVLVQVFWDAVVAVVPAGLPEQQAQRRGLGTPGELRDLWARCGLADVVVEPLDVEAAYEDGDAVWATFTRGVGPVGAYVATLPTRVAEDVRAEFLRRLGSPAGPVRLPARAWAVRGRRA